MPGIFPSVAAGGVVIRDGDGVCLDPPGVLNGYCPPAEFVTSCEITMLPEDCTARILPSQINAIVSELLCFAEFLAADGPWNCDGVCNLSEAFAAWWLASAPAGDGVTITVAPPFGVIPLGTVNAICASAPAFNALVSCLISADANNLLTPAGGDPGLYVTVTTDGAIITGNGTVGSPISIDIADLITAICTTPAFRSALATCLVSATANNAITISASGLFVNSAAFVPVARQVATQDSLTGGGDLSANRTLRLVNDVAAPGNLMLYGTDGAGVKGWRAESAAGWIVMAPQAAAGAILNFGSIPSTAREIVIQYLSLSGTGSNDFLVQIGDAGGLETTGYVSGTISVSNSSNSAGATSAAGFISYASAAARIAIGTVRLTRVGNTNEWLAQHVISTATGDRAHFGGGSKTLSATLDRLAVLLTGADTFDGGVVGVMYRA